MKSVFFSFFLVVLFGVQSCSSDSHPIIEDIEEQCGFLFHLQQVRKELCEKSW